MRQSLKITIVLAGLLAGAGNMSEALALDAMKLQLQETYRVRVLDGASTKEVTGKLVGQNDTSLFLKSSSGSQSKDWSSDGETMDLYYEGPTVEIPWKQILGLEKRTQESKKGTGALIGLAVGAGLGAIIGYSDGDDPAGFVSFSAGAKAGMAAIVMAPIGALIGVVAAPGEKWEPAPMSLLDVGFTVGTHGERGIVFSARF